ncbi:NmrA family NAD(P)-binding protein [Pseudomonas alliivorans]|uniref:NmrA family NAD(P)-binding protein n=1 Tax=Pseudomonas alliivorans TaxID=2810613 RepID=UPI002ED2B41C|nr:NmrA family NAD(P)-binding protein [Pseudomonas alliivorans]MEE4996975.1 NmrA family NAD(P)-binding protein [Pseudomonas alliivorans]MEE5131169.1 NmrA family NAD(P)-binding protein [Pseudomonas alliivorans]MEE5168851.1 NmrA family NAD(P)-binding protein [Pseudomonas alliivorans]
MSILVIGATGTVGSLVVQRLAAAGAEVKALVRQPGKASFPTGVTEVVADMTDVPSMRAALSSVRTLFLLNAVTPDEVTQALITLNLAQEKGIKRIVYLSVIHADRFTNVPHFTGKHTVERMIETLDVAATILRPAYFMQNEGMVQQTIQDYSVYPMPIGHAGVSMIDARDIADIAVAELLRLDRAPATLERLTLELVGPQVLTGPSVAKIWSSSLGREVVYGGDDVAAFEAQMASYIPGWLAYDLRLMMSGIQKFGMQAADGTVDRLQAIIGRPLRTYESFVREATGSI